jgi:hypothetical protein
MKRLCSKIHDGSAPGRQCLGLEGGAPLNRTAGSFREPAAKATLNRPLRATATSLGRADPLESYQDQVPHTSCISGKGLVVTDNGQNSRAAGSKPVDQLPLSGPPKGHEGCTTVCCPTVTAAPHDAADVT